jgi:hypothetical protein
LHATDYRIWLFHWKAENGPAEPNAANHRLAKHARAAPEFDIAAARIPRVARRWLSGLSRQLAAAPTAATIMPARRELARDPRSALSGVMALCECDRA